MRPHRHIRALAAHHAFSASGSGIVRAQFATGIRLAARAPLSGPVHTTLPRRARHHPPNQNHRHRPTVAHCPALLFLRARPSPAESADGNRRHRSYHLPFVIQNGITQTLTPTLPLPTPCKSKHALRIIRTPVYPPEKHPEKDKPSKNHEFIPSHYTYYEKNLYLCSTHAEKGGG